jgi:hypothetical protein
MKRSWTFTGILMAAGLAAGLVGPMAAAAQIQVSEEPRHHKVFENEWVRVLDVHIPPGDTSLMHKHSTPSVFMVLSQTKTGSEVLVEPAKTNFSDGHIWFEAFYDKPRIHRVWNIDTTEFHVVDMEILNKEPRPIDPPVTDKRFSLLFDERPVRGYRVALPAGERLPVMRRKAAIVVVGLSDVKGGAAMGGQAAGEAAGRTAGTGSVTVNGKRFVKRGDYIFIGPGGVVDIVNHGAIRADFAVFELK